MPTARSGRAAATTWRRRPGLPPYALAVDGACDAFGIIGVGGRHHPPARLAKLD